MDRNLRKHGWGGVLLCLISGGLILLALYGFGGDCEKELKALEAWAAGQGKLGLVIFIAVVVISTSFFVPSTLLSAGAGVLFGLGWGSFAMIIGCIIGAVLNYVLADKFFSARIIKLLHNRPKLLMMQNTVKKGGLRLQLLLRMVPISAVLVNYVLGAAGVPFRTYILATAGLIPGIFVEVYFGHVAKHVTSVSANAASHSTAHTMITIGGFLLCVIILIRVGRVARQALAEAGAM